MTALEEISWNVIESDTTNKLVKLNSIVLFTL